MPDAPVGAPGHGWVGTIFRPEEPDHCSAAAAALLCFSFMYLSAAIV